MARRIAEGLVVLIVISAAVFALTEAAPGRFTSELRANAQISAHTIALLEQKFHLDAPLYQRYASWAQSAVAGDFGYSALYGRPVGEILWPRLLSTLQLASAASLLAWLLAVPAGLWSGLRAGGTFDRVATAGSSLFLGTPDLVAGLAVVWFAASTGWFPVGGGAEAGASWTESARALLLPVIGLAAVTTPVIFRHTRTAVIDALHSRAVIAARLHGLSTVTVAVSHVLPLAAVPLAPLFALSIASLLSASLVIEVVVAWPGLGPLMLDAVLGRDLHLLVASTLMSAVVLIAAATGGDVLLRWLDPRVGSAKP